MTVGYAIIQKRIWHHGAACTCRGNSDHHKIGNGYVSWGSDAHHLQRTIALEEGMILHIPENEWHAFHYDEGGCVEIVFIYGQGDNCRPEDNER